MWATACGLTGFLSGSLFRGWGNDDDGETGRDVDRDTDEEDENESKEDRALATLNGGEQVGCASWGAEIPCELKIILYRS